MTKLLEEALLKVKSLPDSRQDEIGEMILGVVEQDQSKVTLSPEQVEEVKRRINDPNPVFATDEQVEALFGKFAT